MKIEKIPYYAKFVFMGGPNECISTADVNLLTGSIVDDSGEPINSLKIGDKISFENYESDIFKIKDIQIQALVTDTDNFHQTVSVDDCAETQGQSKEHLFRVVVRMDKTKK